MGKQKQARLNEEAPPQDQGLTSPTLPIPHLHYGRVLVHNNHIRDKNGDHETVNTVFIYHATMMNAG